jgi:hypothetical protein
MAFKPMDDAVYGNSQSWPAFATHRLVANNIEILTTRGRQGNWSSNALLDRNGAISNLHRRVRLGSSPSRPCGQIWQWGPSPTTNEIRIEAYVQNETRADVYTQWFFITDLGLVAATTKSTVAGLSGFTLKQWDIPLAPIQDGGNRPYVIYLFLQVTSDTSDDPLDEVVYDRGGVDHRSAGNRGIKYGHTWLETQTSHFQNIDLYEVVDVVQSDNLGGKSTLWANNYVYQGRPYMVHLRHNDYVIWYPRMEPFAYFAAVNCLTIHRMGELTLFELQIRDLNVVPSGPIASTGALIRSLAGGQPARGSEHVQLWRAQDEAAYALTPVHSFGPQIVGRDDYHKPVNPFWSVDGAVTSFAFYSPIIKGAPTWNIIGEWRINEDANFNGDVGDSQRRMIEILPMWLLLGRLPDLGERLQLIRLSFITSGGVVFDQQEITLPMQPYHSDFIEWMWFGVGRLGDLNWITRTFFSSSALFESPSASQILKSTFRQPLFKFPTDEGEADFLRLEVRLEEDDALAISWMFVDLGTIVRGAEAGTKAGRTISSVVGVP